MALLLVAIAWTQGARAQATLMTGLGGPQGFGPACMPPNDDGSWPDDNVGMDITPAFPNGLHFYQGTYTRGWINNNGNLSFQSEISQFTPNAFPGAPQPMIAPYWGDVDTRDTNACNDPTDYPDGQGYPPGDVCTFAPTNIVWWALSPGQFVITWNKVGVFNCHQTPVMTFQMILSAAGCGVTAPDGGMAGTDFDVEFRYAECGWEAGDASGGSGGFCPNPIGGCTPAQAGFDSAEHPDMDYWSLPMSRKAGISTELCTQSNLTPAQPGIWRFSVRGGVIQCPMAGQPCMTNMPGICAQGQLQCSLGGSTTCQPITMPQPSQCNGLDNDCDGTIDTGPCPAGEVCAGAQCVPSCQETGCPPGNTCVNSVCMETACVHVTCPAGQRCTGGSCVDACSGVTCPLGQVCRLGSCVDPCAGLNCGAGQVCENGMCVPTCMCNPCAANQTCAMSGACVDTACATVTCPTGQVCQGGSCVDACTGAVCPKGQMCQTGQCVPMPPMGVDSGPSLIGPGGKGDGGVDGGAANGAEPFGTGAKSHGCGCRTTGSDGAGWLPVGLGLAVAAALARRRRRAS